MKVNPARIPEAIETLTKIRQNVRSQHGGVASFLLVLTNGGYAYRDENGVFVVPIGCLKP
jgi:hypothetical protein